MTTISTGKTLPRGNGMIPYSDEALTQLFIEIESCETVGRDGTCNIPAAFDTECSSFYDKDGNKVAVCYIWMLGINNTVIYSRELEEFNSCINVINEFCKMKDRKLIIYVHNLQYDFSFIKTYLQWSNVFMRKKRSPLYARYGKVEIRDSLILAGGRSLAKIGRELRRKVQKAVGDLDYKKLRFPETPLTDLEMHYCEMDIRTLCEYIREKIEDETSIKKIPYTNTGYVRRYVKNECLKNRNRYLELMDNLTLTPDCYIQCEQAFTGGAVGGNLKYIGKTLHNVHSYDIKSSYPYVMCTQYFPMSYFYPVKTLPRGNVQYGNIPDIINQHLTTECCLFQFEAWDVEPITPNFNPLSANKCQDTAGARIVSNHIMTAFYLKTQMTELDFDTFCKYYKFSECRFSRFRVAKRGFLPEPIIRSILKFFNDKTTLDGIKERKADYMIAKNMLNSVYGMMVERIVRAIVRYMNDKGIVKENPDYVQQIVDYNNKYDRFLYYPWGVWVTAHARHRLFDAILAVGDDFVYCDTDSVKYLGEHTEYFDKINKEAEANIKKLAERLNLSIDYVIPTSPKGKKACLGVWESEGTYKKFKTLGAKRYLVKHRDWTKEEDEFWRTHKRIDKKWVELPRGNNDEYYRNYADNIPVELTVAGSNKNGTLAYILEVCDTNNVDPFDKFDFNLVVPEEYAGRTIGNYIDEARYGWATDYLGNRCYYYAPSGLHIEESTYTFSQTEDMKRAIEGFMYEGEFIEGDIS